MVATVHLLGVVVTALGLYMTAFPERAARRHNAGLAKDPEPTIAHVWAARLAGLTFLLVGVPTALDVVL